MKEWRDVGKLNISKDCFDFQKDKEDAELDRPLGRQISSLILLHIRVQLDDLRLRLLIMSPELVSHKLDGSKEQKFILSDLEACSPKSRCPQSHTPSETCRGEFLLPLPSF